MMLFNTVACLLALASLSSLEATTDFRKVYKSARDLESTGSVLTAADQDQDLRKLVGSFLREPKSEIVADHLVDLRKTVENVQSKTLSLLAAGKENNFASNFKRGFMLFFSNMNDQFDPEIKTYSDGLNWLIVNNQLTEPKVACAMENLKAKHLSIMMFVLRTDMKHLILSEIGVVERAILSYLESQRFSSTNDYYNQAKLSQVQENALADFYQLFRDTKQARADDFLDHVINPNRLLIGRLMDSCSAVMEHYPVWKSARDNQDSCTEQVSIFRTNFLADKDVEELRKFCSSMIHGLD